MSCIFNIIFFFLFACYLTGYTVYRLNQFSDITIEELCHCSKLPPMADFHSLIRA